MITRSTTQYSKTLHKYAQKLTKEKNKCCKEPQTLLPRDVWIYLLHFLPVTDKLTMRLVSRIFALGGDKSWVAQSTKQEKDELLFKHPKSLRHFGHLHQLFPNVRKHIYYNNDDHNNILRQSDEKYLAFANVVFVCTLHSENVSLFQNIHWLEIDKCPNLQGDLSPLCNVVRLTLGRVKNKLDLSSLHCLTHLKLIDCDFDGLSNLTKLTSLSLLSCKNIKEIPCSLQNLSLLHLLSCNNIVSVPLFPLLENVSLLYMPQFSDLCTRIMLPSNVKYLSFGSLSDTVLFDIPEHLTNLLECKIYGKMMSIPKAPFMKKLNIRRGTFQGHLPRHIHHLHEMSCLEKLSIVTELDHYQLDPLLTHVPEQLSRLNISSHVFDDLYLLSKMEQLTRLNIQHVRFRYLPHNLQHLQQLKLYWTGIETIRSFPLLHTLIIYGCHHLTTIESSPNLLKLVMEHCHGIRDINNTFPKLKTLVLRDNGFLKHISMMPTLETFMYERRNAKRLACELLTADVSLPDR